MLKVITDETAIKRCQGRFVRGLRRFASERISVKLGHPGAANKHTKVVWSERLGIWFCSRRIAGNRYWNGFGIGRPREGETVAVTCEINFPLLGIDRRVGGVFAEDRAGRLFVLHRGRLGGGRKGIGKSLFNSSYRGTWEVMDDDGEETPVAVIGVLQSLRLARQITGFVQKVGRIKELAARSSQAELLFGEFCLHEELIGARWRDQEREIGAECDHGLVVLDLAEILQDAGLRVGNDGNRDLVAMDRAGRIRAVFQVHTEATLADIHAGATQLLLSSLSLPDNPILILILPRLPEESLSGKLKRLNIDILLYQWQEDRALFPGLAALLALIAS